MFNLLTDDLKEKIKANYRLRRLVVLLIFIIFLQVSFLIFLFPSWIASLFKEKESILQTEKMNQSLLSQNTDSIASTITTINTKLNIINNTLEYHEVIPIINTILSNKTGSIHINSLTYGSVNASTSALTIQGISATRESLVLFVKSLKKSETFKVVDLPVSNLTKDKNIDFVINLSTKI